MQVIKGYLEDGRFMPAERVTLPRRVQAVLVINDAGADADLETRLSWLNEFHEAVSRSAGEEMPDFPRVHFERPLVDLSGEG